MDSILKTKLDFQHFGKKEKEMKAFTIRKIRTLLPAVFSGIILFFLLSGKHHFEALPCKNFTTPSKEYFEPDVEPWSEPDSGTDKSNMKVTSAVMIGLPF